jgi:hypothetical protein
MHSSAELTKLTVYFISKSQIGKPNESKNETGITKATFHIQLHIKHTIEYE